MSDVKVWWERLSSKVGLTIIFFSLNCIVMSWLYAAAKQQRGIRQLFGDFMSQHFNIKLNQDEQFFFL